jgi:hypothetical protein
MTEDDFRDDPDYVDFVTPNFELYEDNKSTCFQDSGQ